MKLLKDEMYISKSKWRQLFLAMSIMVIILYIVAMICSLCGSDIFILKYQNEHMDKIEAWFKQYKSQSLISALFLTLEYYIVQTFSLKKSTFIGYVLIYYLGMIIPAFFIDFPDIYYSLYPYIFYILVPIIDLKINKSFTWKIYLITLLRVLIATIVSLMLQAMILVIKAGYFDGKNHIMNLSAHFIYAIEYDIALSIILFTVALFLDREKGDSKQWMTSHTLGGSSQASKTQLQKSKQKNLTKTQKNKIRLFYIKMYFIQLGTFLLVMVLPFLLGKVLEFLVMYLAFCVARAILGFKYSLHYKKESLCATVGVVVFGILSLAVPFFYVVLIIAVTLGVGLAILLHLSYKYKGFYLFNKIAKPDKFAELYVIMDGDLSRHHVEIICKHRGLAQEETSILLDFAEGNKKSYIAHRHHYDLKTIERRINTAIDKLHEKD